MQELRVNKTRNLSSCEASEDILFSKARKVPNLSWAVFINQVTSRKLVRTDRTSEDSSGLREAALKCAEVLPTIRYHQVRFFFILSSSSSFMSFLGGKFAFTRSYVDRTAMVCSAAATASDSVVVVVVLIVCSGAPLVRVLLPTTPRSKACSYTSWRSSAKAAVQHGSKLGIDFWRAQERLLLGLLFAPAKLTV